MRMHSLRLWIAFKCVSLQEEKQRCERWECTRYGCELLSNVYLCKRKNNENSVFSLCHPVVNCFQMCIFARGKTTYSFDTLSIFLLWIAFKCVSLQEEKQQHLQQYPVKQVVNCFQMCIFARGKTTMYLYRTTWKRLWIAFKCVSLQEEKQLNAKTLYEMICCELLSNVYLCKRKNNQIEGNNSQT